MNAKGCRPSNDFRAVMAVSDALGLSSFYTSRLYRCSVLYRGILIACILAIHFSTTDADNLGSRIQTILNKDRVKECHEQCLSLPCSRPSRKVLLHFLLFLTHFLLLNFYYHVPVFRNFIYALAFIFSTQVPAIQFDYLVTSVTGGIREVNKELKKFVSEGNQNDCCRSLTKRDVLKIEALLVRQTQLRNLTSRLIKTYSRQIIVVIAQFSAEMYFIIQTSYFDYIRGRTHRQSTIFDSILSSATLDVFLKMYVVLTLFYKLMLLGRTGQKYLSECHVTDVALFRILNTNCGRNCQVDNEIKMCMMQNILNPASMSLNGLINLDHKLMYNIGCTTLNYGIITGMFYLGNLSALVKLD